MKHHAFSFLDRFPGESLTCVRCLERKPKSEFDRLLWCEACRARAAERAKAVGWMGGGVIALVVGLYIWLVVRPTGLIPQLWLAALVAVYWLGARFVREIALGVMRYRNSRAAEARPPEE
ncbi:MAG: hypothetical protein R3E98_19145 [Gemmatimonadota bacterium]